MTMITQRLWIAMICCFGLICVGQPAQAYPTSANIMPTADTLDKGSLRVEYENDGYPTVGGSDSINYAFAQLGVTPHLEIGLDQWDLSHASQTAFNAKGLLAEEKETEPAVAVGVMDLAEGQRPTAYAVATKTFGKFRLHLGGIHADYSKGLMAGLDQEIGEGTYLLMDRLPGSENFLAVGVYKEFPKRWALTVTYGFANSNEAEDLTAVNLSYTFATGP